MSLKKPTVKKELEQSSIKRYITRSPLSEIQERAKQLEVIQKQQERVKQITPLESATKPKRKTPLSIEEDPSKQLHFEDTSPPADLVTDTPITMSADPKEQ